MNKDRKKENKNKREIEKIKIKLFPPLKKG